MEKILTGKHPNLLTWITPMEKKTMICHIIKLNRVISWKLIIRYFDQILGCPSRTSKYKHVHQNLFRVSIKKTSGLVERDLQFIIYLCQSKTEVIE